MRFATLPLLTLAVLTATSAVRAEAPSIDAAAAKTRKSLVVVDYTYRSENMSREETGQGILLDKDGTVLISGALIPETMPKDYIKEIKVRAPGRNFSAVPAKFLGRTPNRLFAFIKADEPLKAEPLDTAGAGDPKLGQEVFSVAIAPKGAGYESYVGSSHVRAIQHLSHDLASTSSFGLTRGTSPVFDVKTGALLGITLPAFGDTMILRDESGTRRVELRDDDQSGNFLPWSECEEVFKDIPTKPFESRRPWLGLDGLVGLDEDVRALNNITQPAAVSLGAVVPEQPGAKAGLQNKDIVLTVDGKEFSTSSVPEMMTAHLQRAIEKKKVGDTITFGILRDGKKQDITATIGPSPKMAAEMPLTFNAKLGVTTRDLVWADAYSRKLPTDTKGVVVALVKPGAPAAVGTTPLRPGYLITRINDQDVENEKQFGDTLAKALEDKEKTEIVFRVIQLNGETMVCRVDLSK